MSRPVPDLGEVTWASKANRCPHARFSVASTTCIMFVRSEESSTAFAEETFARISRDCKKVMAICIVHIIAFPIEVRHTPKTGHGDCETRFDTLWTDRLKVGRAGSDYPKGKQKMTRTIHKAGCIGVCLWLISSSASAGIKASGGELRILDGQYAVHTFTNSSRMVIKEGGLIDILLVGGGGGGGASSTGGGGGGAGGFVYRQGVSVTPGVYDITVGAGGAGGYTNGLSTAIIAAENGGDSEAFGILAHGGGAGGCNTAMSKDTNPDDASAVIGKTGGSGGGSAVRYQKGTAQTNAGGDGMAGEGFPGGAATNGAASYNQGHIHCWAGGGGGAGGSGGNGVCTQDIGTGGQTRGMAGVGGDGVSCAITGEEIYYAGGGGGGYADYSYTIDDAPSPDGSVSGGIGGGGCGSGNNSAFGGFPGHSGIDGFGGGGGGGGFSNKQIGAGGKGGDGVVIVRYHLEGYGDSFRNVEMIGGEMKKYAGYHIYTFTNNGTFKVSGYASAEVLLVGGGGGGGASQTGGGGGGAGGFVHREAIMIPAGEYSIVVGAGGVGGCTNGTDLLVVPAENGGDTVAFGIVAAGGGAGGSESNMWTSTTHSATLPSYVTGRNGGSGGGGTCRYSADTIESNAGGEPVLGTGFAGGACANGGYDAKTVYGGSQNQGHTHCWAGGGGGAGGAGGSGSCTQNAGTGVNTTGQAGAGGSGVSSAITGSEIYYAGGGGGGFADYSYTTTGATVPGGLGGGGAGSGCRTTTAQFEGVDGEDGLGGGGGGGGGFVGGIAKGGRGGCGVVIIRCKIRGKGLVITVN